MTSASSVYDVLRMETTEFFINAFVADIGEASEREASQSDTAMLLTAMFGKK